MKIMKTFFVLMGLIFATAVSLSAFQDRISENIVSDNTILVTADQIVINSEGIFIYTDAGVIPVREIIHMNSGIFLVNRGYECPHHGTYCPRCGGCYPGNTCQYRCKCPKR